jgi:multidrug transporter EmrE-like cation transporter
MTPRQRSTTRAIGCIICAALGITCFQMAMPSINFDAADRVDTGEAIVAVLISAIFFWQSVRILLKAIRG